ncbi:ABC transporter ATP-binding protein [Bradyrhizobium sp. NP1]|uniref:ABC transporter ATP-binding protein n=1 Tax=Bradyrhizobium sp. NP1 TaxID=3049772 RepID=UPI0025A4DA8F|nr:ABC transporter ATP-binding protein [Bradyrhizobium sp. NP1]WJR81883.1 ABC transporter ATP-binding protein [Bradyrhizobium sp. NP1]
MLAASDIHVSYGKINAVKGVSVEIGHGEIVALIGPNGAGKSTLLKAIAGLLPVRRGSIVFDGAELAGRPAAEVMRRGLALVLEGRSTLKHMTVRENLVLGAYARGDHAAIAEDLDQMLTRFPVLRDRLKQRAGTLSGGEQQMLVIARALMSRPRLLMLDEPSLGLAPLVTAKIFELIHALKSVDKVTVLLVEQNANQALQLADRAYVLENGVVALAGKDLANDPRVREAYLGV